MRLRRTPAGGGLRLDAHSSRVDDALFVFNDNESQFRAYRADRAGGAGCSPGGGNAVIRPYRRVFSSADAGDPALLGTGTFRVGDDVRRSVVTRLRALGEG
ncbi:MAG: hypothetical protein WCA29_10990 [Jiangellales bacterium]